jgi:Fic family protein
MKWNWEQPDWPSFKYRTNLLCQLESDFLKQSGVVLGAKRHIDKPDEDWLIVELMSDEALKTSEIEGAYLNRDSLQSSIRRQFGLATDHRKIPPAEQGIAEMTVELYRHFDTPLTDESLFQWHQLLMKGRSDLNNVGAYRTHSDPMQVVSGAIYNPTIHFEAPPSEHVPAEMADFIQWFNDTAPTGARPLSPLIRAGITHLYFVSIHPFEDGNGRLARALAEKSLSQSLNSPTLIALSSVIYKYRKLYYDNLAASNKQNEISSWLLYFASTVVEAQGYTQTLIEFLIEKTKLYDKVKSSLNPRQDKVLSRLFREGPDGFKGGLSAEKYQRIAKTSPATATRDLTDLVEKEVFSRVGEKKGTRYCLRIKTLYEGTPP